MAVETTLADRVGHAVVEGVKKLEEKRGEGRNGTPEGATPKRTGSLITQALAKGLCCEWFPLCTSLRGLCVLAWLCVVVLWGHAAPDVRCRVHYWVLPAD
jgi:hypothetical protein